MRDLDLVDQWNPSTSGQYPNIKRHHTQKPDAQMSNQVLQHLKAAYGLEEDAPAMVHAWPRSLNHPEHKVSGMQDFFTFEQLTKMPEYWPFDYHTWEQEPRIPEWESSMASSEHPLPTAPCYFSTVTPLGEIDTLSRSLMQTPDAHCTGGSTLPRNLKEDISQGISNSWPVNTGAMSFCIPERPQHSLEVHDRNYKLKGPKSTGSLLFGAHEGLVHRVSTATNNIAQDIQSLQLNPSCFSELTRASDRHELKSSSDPSASGSDSPPSPVGSLNKPSNDGEQFCASGSSSDNRTKHSSLQGCQNSREQASRVTVSKGSPHSGKRKSFLPGIQQKTSDIRSRASERERKKSNGAHTRAIAIPKASFQIVQEDGKGGSITNSPQIFPIIRARRQGPLSADGRRDAALRRKDKSVCLWCRLSKKKVKPVIAEQPCVRADFFQIVESGTCNYISQRAVNHLTLDGRSRRRMELPSTLDFEQFISSLEERQGKFNIRVRQAWGTLCILDLKESYDFLKNCPASQDQRLFDLRAFIDNHVLKFNNWQKCIKGCNPTGDVISLLSKWNNMPSRASYDFIPQSEGILDRPMNIEDPNDRIEILLAAQLSQIFCRKLEVDGYRVLQHALNKNKWDDIPYESFLKFVSQLGHILVSLRWRVSWWELLGDGGTKPDIHKERYEDRVKGLCKVLYFYYVSVKLKLPSWMTPGELDGVWSTYADADQVWDDFPSVATIEGFEMWMQRGKALLKQAGVRDRISNI
ncbi:conserved hypothetical protein [Uncinocarpus reesii 1704]|uniref:Uncharacterized protein n=1 Tax=Uncinocarpus reesii (strain UAMH 1704) TaxID=336963 RepID=C4JJK0_UNCRE|nr:uncharacterized protein UREG_01807 [Uncinocarpus reesii 1704]EEP76958.1 conserved hypothetical protein [Uncinocarpus reesii 1704]